MRTYLKWIAAATLCLSAMSVRAEPAPADPAISQISTFNDALLQSMKTSQDREKTLAAAIDKTFNTPFMTQFIVGPAWAKLTPAEKQSVQAALRNYMVVRFASAFNNFSGEKFSIDPAPKLRGVDALVKTTIQAPKETPEKLDYRMRKYGDTWRVIDVYYNGVSDLTTQRSDLASTAATGGASAIVNKIQAATKKLR